VILSFIPMFFITGMMGPYMRPMALNVPVAMLMSMLVAFTITPWLSYHVLKGHYAHDPHETHPAPSHAKPPEGPETQPGVIGPDEEESGSADLESIRNSTLWKIFYPLMAPLLRRRLFAWTFVLAMGVLTVAAMTLAALRAVPLKMLPFDNKNELLLV